MTDPDIFGRTRSVLPVRVMAVRNGTVTGDPDIERAILNLLSFVDEKTEGEIAGILLLVCVQASRDELFREICIAKINRLIDFGVGFGNLKIAQKGVERLDELIHQDMTRIAQGVASDTLADILSAMGLRA